MSGGATVTGIVNGGVTIVSFYVFPDEKADMRGSLAIDLKDGYTREELIFSLKEQVCRIESAITNKFQKIDVEFYLPDSDTLFFTFQIGEEVDAANYVLRCDDISSPETMKVIGFAKEIHRAFFSQN
jgi:hypothetical protein